MSTKHVNINLYVATLERNKRDKAAPRILSK